MFRLMVCFSNHKVRVAWHPVFAGPSTHTHCARCGAVIHTRAAVICTGRAAACAIGFSLASVHSGSRHQVTSIPIKAASRWHAVCWVRLVFMTKAQLIICCSKRVGRWIMQAYFTRQTGKNEVLNLLFDPILDPCFDTALSWDYPSQCWYACQCNAYIIKAETWIWIFFFFFLRSVSLWRSWAAASCFLLPRPFFLPSQILPLM